MESRTELVPLIKIVLFFFSGSSIRKQWDSLVAILGSAQRKVNPRESWEPEPLPLREKEALKGGRRERDFPTLGNHLQNLQGRGMTPLTPRWTLLAPPTPTPTYGHTDTVPSPATGPLFHQPASRHFRTTMIGFLFVMEKVYGAGVPEGCWFSWLGIS